MIILDTNIVSEFMSSPPAGSVLHWLNEQPVDALYLTSITIAEISFGLDILPIGRRRALLEERFQLFIDQGFHQRILNFDKRAAKIYGNIMSHRRKVGRSMSCFDGQIAAIARAKGFALATRNTKDFEDCALTLMNPFAHKAIH